MRIGIAHVGVGPVERSLIAEVLDHGALVQGNLVAQLEESFMRRAGSAFAVATSSGTTALQLALEVAGVGAGDHVITTPFTFGATLNSILGRGAVAHLVDIDSATFNLDPLLVRAATTPLTKAVVPVHLYGLAANMDGYRDLRHESGIRIIEDAAQAHFAVQAGYRVGTMDLGCFSLYATKNLITGEGGVVTGASLQDRDQLRLLRNQGMREPYNYEAIGYNYRLTEVAAAIGLGQMVQLEARMAARARNAAILTAALEGLPGLIVPSIPAGYWHVWHQYTVRLTDRAPLTRDELVARLHQRGIEARVYYPKVLADYPIYAHHPNVVAGPLPNARLVAQQVVSLPVHHGLTPEEVAEVAQVVTSTLGRA
jgi:dTDP-4-amino-4,6-dideoxygalactose transaminase